ncbi:MAG: transporter [Acidobacteria bacterium]|nr:transporter [Acidobacteriota bacterium]
MSRERRRHWVMSLLLVGGLGISSPELRAQEIVAPSARTLFNRATLVRSFVEVKHSSLQTDGQSVDVTQYVPVLAVVYGFYPKWTVIVAQPYVTVGVTSRMGNEARQGLNGLADLQLFVQYDGLYSRNTPGGLTRLSGVFGLQVPTGAQRFSTGAVEYTGGLIFQKAVRLKYVFSGDFEYTIATENRQGVSMGDRARFDGALSPFVISQDKAPPGASWPRKAFDRVLRNGAYLILEFNGTWQAHGRDQGNEIANTGGTTLSISPGIQYFLSNSFLVEFSAPLPVIKALNGTQPKPQSTFVFGFRYLF